MSDFRADSSAMQVRGDLYIEPHEAPGDGFE
jgi:hypothetical protein